MPNEHNVICPKCGTEIDVNTILYKQLQSELEAKFKKDLDDANLKYEKLGDQLKAEKEAFEKEKRKEKESFSDLVNNRVAEEKKLLESAIKLKIDKEKSDELTLLQAELKEKSDQVKDLNKNKAENEKLKRLLDEVESNASVQAQKVINETLTLEREKIKKSEKEKNELVIKELEKKLEDQKALTDEMQRRQEQGSMQLQGEVQELALEEWLRSNFPLDTITEIKKGVRGADCMHVVNTRLKENCGSIYYESKRTKDFGKDWIEKFKNDIRESGATTGIIVTEVMPPGMERMGQRDGVWICNFEEFKGLCFVIREHIAALDLALSSQENKGEKMLMLYDYLTSNEFRLQVEGIIEGYTQMQADLETEKRSIAGHWKKREKQLQKVLHNTNYMYNSLRGIAGNAIQKIDVLELPDIIQNEESETELNTTI
jgi:hypothetical protein